MKVQVRFTNKLVRQPEGWVPEGFTGYFSADHCTRVADDTLILTLASLMVIDEMAWFAFPNQLVICKLSDIRSIFSLAP